jgi:hypothetical protein
MSNGLHEVISAAIQSAGREAERERPGRQAPLLRVTETSRSGAIRTESAANTSDEKAFGPVARRWHRAPAAGADHESKDTVTSRELSGGTCGSAAVPLPATTSVRHGIWLNADTVAPNRKRAEAITAQADVAGEGGEASLMMDVPRNATVTGSPQSITPACDHNRLGPNGLRLAFSLCGFHGALMERLRQGGKLTEREELLVILARKDFASLRPFVIGMTLDRLIALVNAPDLTNETAGADAPGAMEAFAVATLRSLAQRACQLLQEGGPDAAFSLFGDIGGEQDPLAIFQRVFTTALDLVEAFERIIPMEAKLLARLAEALDSEVEKI